jgi:hypothetical protein
MPLDTANLVKWLQERPFWIQEATRLLLTKGNLAEQDLSELAAICRQQGAEPKTTPKPAVLPESAFAQKTAGVSLRLNGISEVKGIEALNPRSPLSEISASVAAVRAIPERPVSARWRRQRAARHLQPKP